LTAEVPRRSPGPRLGVRCRTPSYEVLCVGESARRASSWFYRRAHRRGLGWMGHSTPGAQSEGTGKGTAPVEGVGRPNGV